MEVTEGHQHTKTRIFVFYNRWNRVTGVLHYLKNRKINYEESSQLTSRKYSASSQYIRNRASKNTAGGGTLLFLHKETQSDTFLKIKLIPGQK